MDSRELDYLLEKAGDVARAVEGLQGTVDENKTILENIEKSLDRIAEALEEGNDAPPDASPIVEALEALTLVLARPEALPVPPAPLNLRSVQYDDVAPDDALACSQGCGGNYRRVADGGACDTCPNIVAFRDITPHLNTGESIGVAAGYLTVVNHLED